MNVQQELKKLEKTLENKIRELELQLQEKSQEAIAKAEKYAKEHDFVVETDNNGNYKIVELTCHLGFKLFRVEMKWNKQKPNIVDYTSPFSHKILNLTPYHRKEIETLRKDAINSYTNIIKTENKKQKMETLQLKDEIALYKRLWQAIRGKNTQAYNIRQFYVDLYRCGIPVSETLHVMLFGKLLSSNITIYTNNKKIENDLKEAKNQQQLDILHATMSLGSYFAPTGDFAAHGNREDFRICLDKYLHFLLFTNAKEELTAPELDDISYEIEHILSKVLPSAYDIAYYRYTDELVQQQIDAERKELEALQKIEEDKALRQSRKVARKELEGYYSSNIILNACEDLEHFEKLLDLALVPLELKKQLMEKMTKETHKVFPITNFTKEQQMIYHQACTIQGDEEVSYRLGEVNTALELFVQTDDIGLQNDLKKEIVGHLAMIYEMLQKIPKIAHDEENGLKKEFL